MDVSALREEIPVHAIIRQLLIGHLVEVEQAVRPLIVSLLLRILPPLLDPKVEIERQHRLLLLVEVLVVADLVVLHLIKLVQRRLPERPLDLRHELVLVLHDLEQHFFDVLFDCKKVGLDAFLLKEFDLLEHGACRLIPGGVGPRDEAGNLLRELLKE